MKRKIRLSVEMALVECFASAPGSSEGILAELVNISFCQYELKEAKLAVFITECKRNRPADSRKVTHLMSFAISKQSAQNHNLINSISCWRTCL